MQITVSGKQMELSDALRTRVGQQLETIAGKYFDHALDAAVTFSRARSFFTCDINMRAGRGLMLRGEGEAADANGAFDDAAEHIAKRLRRYRRRVNEHSRDAAHRERPQAARQYVLRQEEEEPVAEAAPGAVAQAVTYATVVAEAPAEIAQSVGERCGDADGPGGCAGADVSQLRDGGAERGVSAERREYRLDRSDGGGVRSGKEEVRPRGGGETLSRRGGGGGLRCGARRRRTRCGG